MYKLLLCWRYLRTRYIALISIVSVTLGVATMIVVNSVMAGFTNEMQTRLQGMLGDIIIDVRSMDGVPDADAHMAKIRETVGDAVAGMSPTVQVPALLYVEVRGPNGKPQNITQQVMLVGVDEQTYADVGEFGTYLQHPKNRKQLEFRLRENGYDAVDHEAADAALAKQRPQMNAAGWQHRRVQALLRKQREATRALREARAGVATSDPFVVASSKNGEPEGVDFDPAVEQHTGIILGLGMCTRRYSDGSEDLAVVPGDDVKVSFPEASIPPEAISGNYTIVDFYESKMSEYDSSFAFVPLRKLQESRGMVNPETGVASFTSIQLKLSPGADPVAVRDQLREVFPIQLYLVSTWRDKQGPLLAAVQMETMVLNVMLFMIIAVAGFGILAIFYMIVVEKTRDIGILKSLGASRGGIMEIFLAYGVSLGVVGSGVGLALGLLIVRYLNEIKDVLSKLTGQPVFDPSVYYFNKIPTIVSPWTVSWIMVGAISIAVLASILPARRAARLHPVRALRFE